VASIL